MSEDVERAIYHDTAVAAAAPFDFLRGRSPPATVSLDWYSDARWLRFKLQLRTPGGTHFAVTGRIRSLGTDALKALLNADAEDDADLSDAQMMKACMDITRARMEAFGSLVREAWEQSTCPVVDL